MFNSRPPVAILAPLTVLLAVLGVYFGQGYAQQPQAQRAGPDDSASGGDDDEAPSFRGGTGAVGTGTVALVPGVRSWSRDKDGHFPASYGYHPGSRWRLGMGVDPDRPARPCGQVFDVTTSKVIRVQRNELEFKTEAIRDQRHLDEALGIDAALSAHHRFAGGSFKLSSNMRSRSSLSVDETTFTWVVTARQTFGVEYLSSPVLTEQAGLLLKGLKADDPVATAAFKKVYGTYFVDAVTHEASVSAVVKFESVKRHERESIAMRMKAEFKGATSRGELEVGTDRSRNLDDLRHRMSVCIVARGGEGLTALSPILPAVGGADVGAIVSTLTSYLAGVTWDKAPPQQFHISAIPQFARADEEATDRNEALAELYYAYTDALVRYERASLLLDLQGDQVEHKSLRESAKTWNGQLMQALEKEAQRCLAGQPCRLPGPSPRLLVNGVEVPRPIVDLAIPNDRFADCKRAAEAGVLDAGSIATIEAAFSAVGSREVPPVESATTLSLHGAINLRPLGSLKCLESLTLSGEALESLGTMPGLNSLKTLTIHNTSIATLDGLARLGNLETLTITSCHGLQDVSALVHMRNLGSVRIHDSGVVHERWWNDRAIDLRQTRVSHIEIELRYDRALRPRDTTWDRLTGVTLVRLPVGSTTPRLSVRSLLLTQHKPNGNPDYRLKGDAKEASVGITNFGGGSWDLKTPVNLEDGGPYSLGPTAQTYDRVERLIVVYSASPP